MSSSCSAAALTLHNRLSEMYALWALKIAVILLVFIESMKVGLLAGPRLGTKLFYVAMVMKASPLVQFGQQLACVCPLQPLRAATKEHLLICCLCSQVESTIGFFRVSTISEVCITLAELRIWFLFPFSFFNADFLAEMWFGEECFLVCSQPAQETRSMRLGI